MLAVTMTTSFHLVRVLIGGEKNQVRLKGKVLLTTEPNLVTEINTCLLYIRRGPKVEIGKEANIETGLSNWIN
jgi:hypothetical protein